MDVGDPKVTDGEKEEGVGVQDGKEGVSGDDEGQFCERGDEVNTQGDTAGCVGETSRPQQKITVSHCNNINCSLVPSMRPLVVPSQRR